jgi:hypothetical protein
VAIGAISFMAQAATPAAASCCNCATTCGASARVVYMPVETVYVKRHHVKHHHHVKRHDVKRYRVTPYYVVNQGPVFSGPGIVTMPGYFEQKALEFETGQRVYPYVGGGRADGPRQSLPAVVRYRSENSRVVEVQGGDRIIVYKNGRWRRY